MKGVNEMSYAKIEKHQAFLAKKSAALKVEPFNFNKSTMRNKRLMALNNLILEQLLILNNETMNEVVEDFAGTQNRRENKMNENTEVNLKDLAHELDREMGSINCSIITLEDVRTLTAHLREDMDNVNQDYLKFEFRDFHRTVRVLDELMRYTVKELENNFNKAYDIKSAIFKKVVFEQEVSEPVQPAGHEMVGMKQMSAERDREFAMEHNHTAFMEEFGRIPWDEQEVIDWVAGIVKEFKPKEKA